jgi:hypothetical protein
MAEVRCRRVEGWGGVSEGGIYLVLNSGMKERRGIKSRLGNEISRLFKVNLVRLLISKGLSYGF